MATIAAVYEILRARVEAAALRSTPTARWRHQPVRTQPLVTSGQIRGYDISIEAVRPSIASDGQVVFYHVDFVLEVGYYAPDGAATHTVACVAVEDARALIESVSQHFGSADGLTVETPGPVAVAYEPQSDLAPPMVTLSIAMAAIVAR